MSPVIEDGTNIINILLLAIGLLRVHNICVDIVLYSDSKIKS